MDEHQRRVWSQMVDKVKACRDGRLDLRTLVQNLQGLMGASDLHDESVVDEFWNHEAPIDMELELRTDDWAPIGAASDERLTDALDKFVVWAQEVLAKTDDLRT